MILLFYLDYYFNTLIQKAWLCIISVNYVNDMVFSTHLIRMYNGQSWNKILSHQPALPPRKGFKIANFEISENLFEIHKTYLKAHENKC